MAQRLLVDLWEVLVLVLALVLVLVELLLLLLLEAELLLPSWILQILVQVLILVLVLDVVPLVLQPVHLGMELLLLLALDLVVDLVLDVLPVASPEDGLQVQAALTHLLTGDGLDQDMDAQLSPDRLLLQGRPGTTTSLPGDQRA